MNVNFTQIFCLQFGVMSYDSRRLNKYYHLLQGNSTDTEAQAQGLMAVQLMEEGMALVT